MRKFNPLQRFLRRSKLLRFLALTHLKKVRTKQADIAWQYTQSVLSGVGTLIFIWAGVERMLNTLICSYHPHAPTKLKARPLPSDLHSKIKYLVEIRKDSRLPEELRDKIADWIPRLGRLSEHRHRVVHGLMFQRNRYSTEWYAQQTTMKEGSPEIHEFKLGNDDLIAKQREVHELASEMAETLNPIFFGEDWDLPD